MKCHRILSRCSWSPEDESYFGRSPSSTTMSCLSLSELPFQLFDGIHAPVRMNYNNDFNNS